MKNSLNSFDMNTLFTEFQSNWPQNYYKTQLPAMLVNTNNLLLIKQLLQFL